MLPGWRHGRSPFGTLARPTTSPCDSSAACASSSVCVNGTKRVGPSARLIGCIATKALKRIGVLDHL